MWKAAVKPRAAANTFHSWPAKGSQRLHSERRRNHPRACSSHLMAQAAQ